MLCLIGGVSLDARRSTAFSCRGSRRRRPRRRARKLQVTFDQTGNVTLVAQNVTVREILAEWARQGGTHDGERQPADRRARVPLLRRISPRAEVIASLLRQAAGYIARRRGAQGAPGASQLRGRLDPPTSNPTSRRLTRRCRAPRCSAPVTTPGSPDDEIAADRAAGACANPPPAAAHAARRQQPSPAPGYRRAASPVPVRADHPDAGRTHRRRRRRRRHRQATGRGGGGGGRLTDVQSGP